MPPRPVLFNRILRDAAALGMTGKAPGAPCKRCRAGSIPAFSTVGSEGNGNPPGLGPGRTRFDSGVPDHAPLAQQAEHLVEAQGMQVRFLRGAPCLTGIAVMRQSSKLTRLANSNLAACAFDSRLPYSGSTPGGGSHVLVAQRLEARPRGGRQCAFESHRGHWRCAMFWHLHMPAGPASASPWSAPCDRGVSG
jgi:hypothetical protein